jgi:hypothetical protein
MLVRLKICDDKESNEKDEAGGKVPFVMSPRGVVSCVCLTLCNASMLDDGGVFSISFDLLSLGVGVSDL